MAIIKNKVYKIPFIKVLDNYSYLKDVFIVNLLQVTTLFTTNMLYGRWFWVHSEISVSLKYPKMFQIYCKFYYFPNLEW